ncbi:MAG: SIMPL domain-containing protein [Marinosulfonomonas sp.]|nr:SIMPL domain-containing protein [Marinosulfonomonas sp.]
MRLIIVSLVAVILGFPAQAADPLGRISVAGQGSVDMIPDMATISLGVASQARTAGEALRVNSKATAAVLDQVSEAGIAARDVQTSGLSLSPVWSNRSNSNTRPSVVGFAARNQVTVRVREIAKLGTILDLVVKSGANEFNGLRFGLQDSQAAREAALKNAVADGMRKASLLADAAGVTLGPLIDLNAHSGGAPQPQMAREMASMQAVPIAQGEVSIRASVSMIFGIAD